MSGLDTGTSCEKNGSIFDIGGSSCVPILASYDSLFVFTATTLDTQIYVENFDRGTERHFIYEQKGRTSRPLAGTHGECRRGRATQILRLPQQRHQMKTNCSPPLVSTCLSHTRSLKSNQVRCSRRRLRRPSAFYTTMKPANQLLDSVSPRVTRVIRCVRGCLGEVERNKKPGQRIRVRRCRGETTQASHRDAVRCHAFTFPHFNTFLPTFDSLPFLLKFSFHWIRPSQFTPFNGFPFLSF